MADQTGGKGAARRRRLEDLGDEFGQYLAARRKAATRRTSTLSSSAVTEAPERERASPPPALGRGLKMGLILCVLAGAGVWSLALQRGTLDQAAVEEPPRETGPRERPAQTGEPRTGRRFGFPSGTGARLPKGWAEDVLGQTRGELEARSDLITPGPEAPWCDAYRRLEDEQVNAVGYDFFGERVCQIARRYRPEKKLDTRRAVEEAKALYGPPAGTYAYGLRDEHEVTYWEDGGTMFKLDSVKGRGTVWLLMAVLVDKAGSVERALSRHP